MSKDDAWGRSLDFIGMNIHIHTHTYTVKHIHTYTDIHVHTHIHTYAWNFTYGRRMTHHPPYRTCHSAWPSTVMYQSVSSGMKPATIACQKVCRARRTVTDNGRWWHAEPTFFCLWGWQEFISILIDEGNIFPSAGCLHHLSSHGTRPQCITGCWVLEILMKELKNQALWQISPVANVTPTSRQHLFW